MCKLHLAMRDLWLHLGVDIGEKCVTEAINHYPDECPLPESCKEEIKMLKEIFARGKI